MGCDWLGMGEQGEESADQETTWLMEQVSEWEGWGLGQMTVD